MRRHGFTAVTEAWSQVIGTDKPGHTGINMYNRATCKIQRAALEQEAAGSPYHVCNGQVGKGHPYQREHQHR